MDNLQVRTLKNEDSDAVSRIYHSIVKNTEKVDFGKLVAEQGQSSCGTSNLVAELDGEVVGFIISYILAGGFGIDKGAWITNVCVDPRFMGKGIGKRLTTELFKHYKAQGIKNVFTSVSWDSTDLLSFYKALSFDRSNFINLRKELD